jgi:hypothetical protein
MVALSILMTFSTVHATERQSLGFGRLTTNDSFADGRDRWRTGSLRVSRVWGPAWSGAAPQSFGDLIELRFGAEVLTPENLVSPFPNDRPYAGILSIGLHTHFERAGTEFALGVDLHATGPSTQLDSFQTGLHDLLGVDPPSAAVKAAQIGDAIYPTVLFEAARAYQLNGSTSLRPFVEAQVGIETYARAGFDVSVGTIGQGELLVRDPTTGQRYRVVRQEGAGTSFVFGADIARVWDSELYQPGQIAQVSDTRARARAGFHWQNDKGRGLFYGVTWLGEEFDSQRKGQFTGSLRYQFRF